jgi:hypothetical protein
MIYAAFAHLADGITSYLGLRKGLSEQNPFFQIFGGSNPYFILITKLAVVFLIILAYRRIEMKRGVLFKILLLMGSILFFNNLILISAI